VVDLVVVNEDEKRGYDSIQVMEDRWMDGIPINMTDDVIMVMVRGYGIQ
jgi:hypothetical protein